MGGCRRRRVDAGVAQLLDFLLQKLDGMFGTIHGVFEPLYGASLGFDRVAQAGESLRVNPRRKADWRYRQARGQLGIEILASVPHIADGVVQVARRTTTH